MEELGGSPLARLPLFSRIDEQVDPGVLSGLTARGGFCNAAPLAPGRQRLSRHENHRGAIGALRPVYDVGLGEPRGHDQLEDHGPVGTGWRRLGSESRSCESVSNSPARLASSPASARAWSASRSSPARASSAAMTWASSRTSWTV